MPSSPEDDFEEMDILPVANDFSFTASSSPATEKNRTEMKHWEIFKWYEIQNKL
jgi:hypothetical protein